MRKTLLWSSNGMAQNYTPITLNQNIESFDEIHYYGSALRMGNTYINNVTEYPVVPNRINLGGPYVVGMWDNSLFLLNNGTQCWLSGTSGYINSSYFWGQDNNSATDYIGALINNRYQDLRPYKIVGINYESSDDRTVLWSSTGNIYNTGITLSEPIQNFKEIEIYASGEENSTKGTHLGKIRFETENGIIGCDCYGYSPWATGYNYILGSDFKLYKNRGYCGSSYFMGMANNTTAWVAGKWVDGNAIKMLQPYKIIGINRLSSGQISPDTFNVSVNQQTGGTVTINKTTGYFGDVVTLSNTPSTDYNFDGYSITGASLTGNQFSINDENVTAQGSFTLKTINFKAIGNQNALMYITATKNGSTTSWNTTTATTVVEKSIPINSTISYKAVSNSYYRCKSCAQTAVNNFTSARQSDPKTITGTGVATANGAISTYSTFENKISWQYSFTMPSNNWPNNKGGIYSVQIVPTGGITNFSSLGGLTMAQCIPGGALNTSNASIVGCTGKVTATSSQNYNGKYINTSGAASKNVWFSAHIDLTGRSNHTNSYWTGTASNGGQRGLKAFYLTTAGQITDPGKNVNNNFYSMSNTTKTTSFNLTGANNQVATNYGWGPQCIRVEATLGVPSNSTSYATACPPNTITNVIATVKCSSWVP